MFSYLSLKLYEIVFYELFACGQYFCSVRVYVTLHFLPKRRFGECRHGFGGCDGLDGLDGFDGFSRFGGFDGLGGFGGFDGFSGFGRFDGFSGFDG